MEIMASEYASALSLDGIAGRIATSRRQLQRCFAELDETSFRACLTRIRTENAARLLRTTNLSVRDVAARVGYKQPAQFAKAFRRQYGVAPAEYRRPEARRSLSERAPADETRPGAVSASC
jgi:transcriptional regulator GlxA family with amidase domain